MPAMVRKRKPAEPSAAERARCWDAFLDAYSAYLADPGVVRAAALHLAGVALETQDPNFDLAAFEQRFGWQEDLACD